MAVTPKYEQIARQLASRCSVLPPGSQLPPEQHLASEFHVSRMTVRQALDRLGEDMVVARIRGRGTFVEPKRLFKGHHLSSFTEDMRNRGVSASARLVGLESVIPSEVVARELGISCGQEVVRVQRLRLADNEPTCHETAHLPLDIAGTLCAADYESSMHEALSRHGLLPTAATRHTSATALPKALAKMLHARDGSPALRVRHTFRGPEAQPLYQSDSYYRADRYEVVAEVVRPQKRGN